MARDLPRNLQHHDPNLPRRTNISANQDTDLAHVENTTSLPWATSSSNNSRLLRLPLRSGHPRNSRLHRDSRRSWLDSEECPKYFSYAAKSQCILEDAHPTR